jgi:hypothetical protein
MSELVPSNWYRVVFKGPKKNRVMVAQYLGHDDEKSYWNLRPLAGTQDLLISDIVSVLPTTATTPSLPTVMPWAL